MLAGRLLLPAAERKWCVVVRSAENFGDDEMEAYLERMVEETELMMVRGQLFFV